MRTVACRTFQVDMSEEESAFQGVVAACLAALVLGVETRLDMPLMQMTRLPWATLGSVCIGHLFIAFCP